MPIAAIRANSTMRTMPASTIGEYAAASGSDAVSRAAGDSSRRWPRSDWSPSDWSPRGSPPSGMPTDAAALAGAAFIILRTSSSLMTDASHSRSRPAASRMLPRSIRNAYSYEHTRRRRAHDRAPRRLLAVAPVLREKFQEKLSAPAGRGGLAGRAGPSHIDDL